jgi:4'-phosphopantetheinyl transferase
VLDLSDGEVHLWCAASGENDDPALIEAARRILSGEEIARMERMHFPRDRHLFLVSHLLVRTTLSHYAGRPPGAWRFVQSEHGKPLILAETKPSPLRFSLAHTAGLAVVAVTCESDIGVDVERVDRPVKVRELINRFFSPEETAELGKLPPGRLQDHFFLYWTLKEAYIKALGRGLSHPLDSFGFHLAGVRPYRIGISGTDLPVSGSFRFALIEPLPSYVAALSVLSARPEPVILRCYQAVLPGGATPLIREPVGLSAGIACLPPNTAAPGPRISG